VKSGLMVGVGEDMREVEEALRDLRAAGCTMVTIGQYLAPSPGHHAVRERIDDELFAHYRAYALAQGFRVAVAGQLVRSSYHAAESYDGLASATANARRDTCHD
jgi:lipoic acid synthetase